MKHLPFLLTVIITLPLFCSGVDTELFSVYEIVFKGENYSAKDSPVRDIEFVTSWEHESGSPKLNIYGFYDGDGKGGTGGNIFKVRFCPVKKGKWILKSVKSNDRKLDGQLTGLEIIAFDSRNKGFWEVDTQSADSRWYKRSDGSHQYIVGNTFYTFLSETLNGKPSGGEIARDINANAVYFNKLRFCLTGDLFPHPKDKPFLDENGEKRP